MPLFDTPFDQLYEQIERGRLRLVEPPTDGLGLVEIPDGEVAPPQKLLHGQIIRLAFGDGLKQPNGIRCLVALQINFRSGD